MGGYGTNDIAKLDDAATNGLSGVSNSLAYRVHENERHNHRYDKLFGLAAAPSGETHRADRITDTPAVFQADAGNDTWGSWLQVLGSSDTPVASGSAYFDFNEILVVGHERNSTPYFMQAFCGESAAIAAGLTAETFTETGLVTGAGSSETGPVIIGQRRCAAGTKVWVRIWAKGQNTGTLDFYIGLHEYEG